MGSLQVVTKIGWKKLFKKKRYTGKMRVNYMDLLIPKFSGLGKRSGLTPERLWKTIVGGAMILQEKNFSTRTLYNCEAAIAWDFIGMRKV